jgi:hypothetical protein
MGDRQQQVGGDVEFPLCPGDRRAAQASGQGIHHRRDVRPAWRDGGQDQQQTEQAPHHAAMG